MTPEEQAQLAEDQAAMAAARDEDTAAEYQTGLPKVSGMDVVAGAPQWLKKLPQNVGIGLLDAAMAANDAIDWFGRQVVQNTVDPGGLKKIAGEQAVAAAVEPGNIDLKHRPRVQNADGTVSSVLSMGANFDGLEVLIPRISEDGRVLSEDQAVDQYRTTGRHLGKFKTVAESNAAAEQIHKDQEEMGLEQARRDAHDPAKNAYYGWRDEVARGSTLSDGIVQSISQYAIPFLGFSKLLGGLRGASALGTIGRVAAAESATAATVLPSDAPRASDLLAMAKHVEGKMGEAMLAVAPDGSLLNRYIDWMTDRENESESEGRFKNVVDNLVLSGAGAGLFKTAAATLKSGRFMINEALGGPVGKGAQGGHISFHGSPHTFDAFDASKIGSGEGQQVYGHGLYFAENPAVANTYRGGGDIVYRVASANLFKHKGDWQKAAADLKSRNDNTSSFAARMIEQSKGNLAKGNLYTVDIPDEVVSKMLQWDKLLSEQPDVLAKLSKFGLDGSLTGGQAYKKLAADLGDTGSPHYAGERAKGRYDENGDVPALASEILSEQGVPGVRYLDGGSRKTEGGTRNLVLFDPKHAKIIKKE